jgi:hypothetical protein
MNMPQPFKRRPKQKVKIAPGVVLMRPALALMIANIAAQWAKLEQSLSLPFATLLSGQEPSALAAYHSFFDTGMRHTQFMNVAKYKGVPQPLLEEADQLHMRVRKTGTRRNKVVHGVWGICDDRPKTLLLCPADAINIRMHQWFKESHEFFDRSESGIEGEFSFDLLLEDYEEYYARDFNSIATDTIALTREADIYWQKILDFSFRHERARRAPPR